MFSIKNRALVTLLDNPELSRQDIATIINVEPSEISRIMKPLVDDEYVVKTRKYITETGRFRDFYMILQKGVILSKKIKDMMLNTQIKIKEDDSNITEITITEFMQTKKKSFSEIVNNISENTFEISKKKKNILSERIPNIRYFFGREKELTALKEKVYDKNTKVTVISGMAGIGKTTLISKFVQEYQGNIFWYKINEWDTLNNIIIELSRFLKCIGKNVLYSYIQSTKKIDISDLSVILENELKDLLMIFDDSHNSEKEIIIFFSTVLEIIKRKKI